MRFKILFLVSFLFLTCSANDNVEVLAKNVTKNGDIVHAKDEVVLYSNEYVITADEAFYNTKNSDLELLGNITILDGVEYSSMSGKAEINLNDNTGRMIPFFMYMPQSDLWMQCKEGLFDAQSYIAKKAITSSCEVQNPDWKMSFSTGRYDKQSKFLHLYNTLFYIKDVPVFYLPYFSFSTDKTRRSGLLRPKYGLSKDEGFYYWQPVYIALKDSWDVEFDPQIRTKRGKGLNTIFRFADSAYSKGKISFGQFSEKSDYAEENKLKNDKHVGYSIYYDRSNLFSDTSDERTQDGLIIDFQYLNDIDYLNTLNDDDSSYNKLITSKLNYFYKRDKDYFGVYGKYYIDTNKLSNDTTLQELPTLHYHKFVDSIFFNNLYYSFDYKSTNYTRDEGSNAFFDELNVPVSIYFPLFSDYLNLKFTENFYFSRVDYSQYSGHESYGQFSKNYHTISLYTDLSKKYDNFFHTLYFETSYVLPGVNTKKGYFESYVPVSKEEKSLNFNLVQFFYDNDGEKRLSHTLRQTLYFSDYKYKYGDLENTLKLYLDNGLSISNTLNYSHQYAKASKVQTSLDWKLDRYTFSFIHTYESEHDKESTDFYTLSASTKYFSYYNFFTSVDYDIKDDFFKSWQLGWKYDRKCWNYIITYREDRTPKLTSSGSDVVNKRGVYILFNIAQIGSINYDFIKESSQDNVE